MGCRRLVILIEQRSRPLCLQVILLGSQGSPVVVYEIIPILNWVVLGSIILYLYIQISMGQPVTASFWSSGDSLSTSTSSHFEASEGFAGTMALGDLALPSARIQWVLMTGEDGASPLCHDLLVSRSSNRAGAILSYRSARKTSTKMCLLTMHHLQL